MRSRTKKRAWAVGIGSPVVSLLDVSAPLSLDELESSAVVGGSLEVELVVGGSLLVDVGGIGSPVLEDSSPTLAASFGHPAASTQRIDARRITRASFISITIRFHPIALHHAGIPTVTQNDRSRSIRVDALTPENIANIREWTAAGGRWYVADGSNEWLQMVSQG